MFFMFIGRNPMKYLLRFLFLIYDNNRAQCDFYFDIFQMSSLLLFVLSLFNFPNYGHAISYVDIVRFDFNMVVLYGWNTCF